VDQPLDSKAEITEEAQDVDQRENVDFWLRWIKAAKKSAKTHWANSREAWQEYDKADNSAQAKLTSDADEAPSKVYPIYWSSCKSMEPAYYARTPKAITKRRFDVDDPISNTACVIGERLGEWLLENSAFDEAMYAAVQDFLHADKATIQLIYEHDTEQIEEQQPVMDNGLGGFIFEDGAPFDGQPIENVDPTTGMSSGYLGVKIVEKHTNQKIRVAPLCYNEVLHTPEAKTEAEIVDRAFYFCISKEDAEKKFEFQEGTSIPWKTNKAYSSDDEDEDRDVSDLPGKYLEGWEIWSKVTNKVYWVCESYREDFLREPVEDPYHLRGFFPAAPFVIGSKPSKSLYPTPVWVHLRPTAAQLNLMYSRVFSLIGAVRRRALVDGTNPEVLIALTQLDSNEFITVQNLQNIVEKGGLGNLIMYLPVQELVQAITELNTMTDLFKTNFYEWMGLPDIMRAASDPVESLGAQELKQGNASDRFRKNRKAIQDLARNALEMMVDLALGVFDDQKIFMIAGGEFLQEEQKAAFPQALALLRDDESRNIRIDIETDSTNFIDEQWAQQQRNTVANTVVTGLQKVSELSQTAPMFVPVALRTLLVTLSGITGGKDFEEGIKKAVGDLVKQAEQPPPQGPPPPDYQAMGLDLQKQGLELQAQKLQNDRLKLEMDQQRASSTDALESFKTQLAQQAQEFNQQLQSAYLRLDEFKAELLAQDNNREESRLAFEAQADMINAQKPDPVPAMPQPAVHININQPKPEPMPVLPIGL
jgi:hypothetical protein